jgi:hypothetical protein
LAIYGKFWNGFISVGGHDLTAYCQAAKVTIGKEVFDLTVFGNAAKVRAAIGLEDHTITATFLEDMADGKVYHALTAMYTAGTATDVIFRLESTTATATNPQFTVPCILSGGQLNIGGQHGALLKQEVTFVSAGAVSIAVA